MNVVRFKGEQFVMAKAMSANAKMDLIRIIQTFYVMMLQK